MGAAKLRYKSSPDGHLWLWRKSFNINHVPIAESYLIDCHFVMSSYYHFHNHHKLFCWVLSWVGAMTLQLLVCMYCMLSPVLSYLVFPKKGFWGGQLDNAVLHSKESIEVIRSLWPVWNVDSWFIFNYAKVSTIYDQWYFVKMSEY